MGEDLVHSNAVFRPSSNYPLADTIPAPNRRPFSSLTCPGERFAQMHRLYSEPGGQVLSRTEPFCKVTGPEYDVAESQRSANKLADFAGEENILTIGAHDRSLLDLWEVFPRKANEWAEKGWKRGTLALAGTMHDRRYSEALKLCTLCCLLDKALGNSRGSQVTGFEPIRERLVKAPDVAPSAAWDQ